MKIHLKTNDVDLTITPVIFKIMSPPSRHLPAQSEQYKH